MTDVFFQCLSGLLFIFAMTTLGSLLTCLLPNNFILRYKSIINGFSAGIMIAAAVWSLILPSLSFETGIPPVVAVVAGVLFGSLFMFAIGKIFSEEGGDYKRFYIAVTAHNVPEGIAVGFAFGAAAIGGITALSALGVAFGIGVQNLPEGAAISLPARKTAGRKKALLLGVTSGMVEPLGGLFGFFLARAATLLLPYLMSFSAGAMIYEMFADVTAEDGEGEKFALGAVLGFIIMMAADVLLG